MSRRALGDLLRRDCEFRRGVRIFAVTLMADLYGGCGEDNCIGRKLLTERWHPSALM